MLIWIDADACPQMVKDIIFRAAEKRQVKTMVVANSAMFIPHSPYIQLIVVERGFDKADEYIVNHSSRHDLAITADVILAAALVDQGLSVINPRGFVYTPENCKEALAMRNLMAELRTPGTEGVGGPRPYNQKDKFLFANSFDRELTGKLQQGPSKS
jgi:uncharacterized protein YaiI (UPF0178 family)